MRNQHQGSIAFPMSQRIADTVQAHGMGWAYHYYVLQHKMPSWQFWCLQNMPSGLTPELADWH